MAQPELVDQAEGVHPAGVRGHGRFGPLLENVSESATACMITMLQGNLFAMTLGHWIIASRTGVISGAAATAALVLSGGRKRVTVALLLALATFAADYWSHPSHFGGAVTEALVTALAAGGLSLVVGRILSLWRARTMASSS